MTVHAGAFDQMISLIEVVSDPARTRRHLAELKDAGTNGAKLEAEKYADGLSRREASLDRREAELQRLAADLDRRAAAGLEVDRRVRVLDVREGELDSRAAVLQELGEKLDKQATDLEVKAKDIERRLAIIKRAAVGSV